MKKVNFLVLYSLFCLAVFWTSRCSAQIITTYAGNGIPGLSGNGSLAKLAHMNTPTGVAVDSSGNVYFADQFNNMVRKVNTSGIITAFAGTGVAGYSGDGGQATMAKLNHPTGVALDRYGNVYIPEFNNNCVRKVTPAGIITTIAGNTSAGYSGDGGPAIHAELDEPWHVIVDHIGNIYIADGFVNQVIRKVDTFGIITTIAGNGTPGYMGDGGPATNAELTDPSGLAVDSIGNVYIADCDNGCIRKVTTAGIITTVVGNGTAGYSGDGGPATAARLASSSDVAIGGDGSLYITDQSNNVIRKVSPSGIITTIAGNHTEGYMGDGGAPLLAEFYFPYGIAVDAYNNIFICDQGNNRVRKIAAAVNVCQGASITLNTEIKGGYWQSANTAIVSIGMSTGVATGISKGIINVYLVVGGDTAIVPVVVDSVTSAGIINGIDSVCPGDTIMLHDPVAGGIWGIQNTTFASIFAGGKIKGIAPGFDTATYTVTNMYGCSDTASFAIDIRTTAKCREEIAIVANVADDNFEVSPNPSTGFFAIRIKNANEKTSVTVYNLYGKLIQTEEATGAASGTVLLNLSGKSPGTYILHIQNGSVCENRKIVVE